MMSLQNIFPILKTERLIMRRLSLLDVNEIFEIRSDPEINKYLNRQQCTSINEPRDFIVRINDGINKNEWIYWAIELNQLTKPIGTICLWNFSEDQTIADIGFELMINYQGYGFMQEAVECVIDYAFNHLKLNSVEGEVDPENMKSIKLMKKNKFVRKTDFKIFGSNDSEKVNTIIYSLTNTKY